MSREILAERVSPGSQLPAEPDLAEHFGVSRSVVRQALARLESAGLVRRAHGAGTFVLSSNQRSWLVQDAGFARDEAERGHDVTSTVLRLGIDTLPLWAADALRARPGSRGVVLERLRHVDGVVTVYDLNFLPEEFAPIVTPLEDEDHGSLYEVLERHGVTVAGGRRIVGSVIAGERFAELLDVAAGDPLLVVEGVDWDETHTPFDCYRTWIRPDRMKIEVQVVPSPTAASRNADSRAAT